MLTLEFPETPWKPLYFSLNCVSKQVDLNGPINIFDHVKCPNVQGGIVQLRKIEKCKSSLTEGLMWDDFEIKR